MSNKSLNNEKQLHAKLVRGVQYVFRSPNSVRGSPALVFERGKWYPVTEAQREHLVLHAVDHVTVSGGGEERPTTEERQKFQFRDGPIEENETDAGASPLPRRRTR